MALNCASELEAAGKSTVQMGELEGRFRSGPDPSDPQNKDEVSLSLSLSLLHSSLNLNL